VKHVQTVESFHKPLPEEYVWTADDAAVATGEKQLSQLKRDDWKVGPHDFRGTFTLKEKPPVATLYVAGPRSARVWINGAMVAEMHFDGGHHMGLGTMSADVSAALRVGANAIAIEAVRGFGSHHHTNALKTSWLNSGEVLVAKIVPAGEGIEAPARDHGCAVKVEVIARRVVVTIPQGMKGFL
jgi:alpha-L-rhamnosidase